MINTSPIGLIFICDAPTRHTEMIPADQIVITGSAICTDEDCPNHDTDMDYHGWVRLDGDDQKETTDA